MTDTTEPGNSLAREDLELHVTTDAATWGMVTATNNALAGPLLLTHGAGSLAFGIYNSAVNLFGLGTALIGLRLANNRGAGRTALSLIAAGRVSFLLLPIVLLSSTSLPVWPLIGLLILWTAAEGIAQPLWIAHLAGRAETARRGAWMARRASIAAGSGLFILVPALVILSAGSTTAALLFAYGAAAAAGVAGLWSVRALTEGPSTDNPVGATRMPAEVDPGFLAAVFLFWFGAAFNRPVLPPFISHDLRAPDAYFAAAAIVAATTGMLIQRWWGICADRHGTRTLLLATGIGASLVPWFWIVAPAWWFGFPIEIIATGCWLGHLLGLMLRSIEQATDAHARPTLIAWTQTAQGAGATLAPLVASLVAGLFGSRFVLFISGALCLVATARMTGGAGAWVDTLILHRVRVAASRLLLPDTQLVTRQLAVSTATPSPTVRPGPRARRITAETISLRRAFSANCSGCAGLGCSTCFGTGLA